MQAVTVLRELVANRAEEMSLRQEMDVRIPFFATTMTILVFRIRDPTPK
jgi:hypothetical protein